MISINNFLKSNGKMLFTLSSAYAIAAFALYKLTGSFGLVGDVWSGYTTLKLVIYVAAMTHITISCMSISFHRYHTHKGVVLNKYVDIFMQTWLWCVTSMSKLDWVSVHMYHHIHSDQDNDPHSPVKKGLMHVLFLGVWDYNSAKKSPDVLKIRHRLQTTAFERFIASKPHLGPAAMIFLMMLFFGVKWGSLLSVINFLISPIFAVGGVNALAHWWGYKNHQTTDNSRNLGFLFPLNFLICGELDHNNHHAHQKSCSFRHKWYEFDIGYAYIKILNAIKLADIRTVYNTKKFKQEFAIKARKLMEYDIQFKAKCERLADDMGQNINDLKEQMSLYLEGKKAQLSAEAEQLAKEIKFYLKQQAAMNLN